MEYSYNQLSSINCRDGGRVVLRFSNFSPSIAAIRTPAAYSRAAAEFLSWCEGQGISALGELQLVRVAA